MTVNSLATGAELTHETFADFVERLKYHCRGEGVKGHITAEALFVVQRRRIITGIDTDYSDQLCAVDSENESTYFNPVQWWEDLSDEERAEFDANCEAEEDVLFLDLSEDLQWEFIRNQELTVTGWYEEWEYVNSHFTKEAAESFIARKEHDYRDGLRIYVEAQIYCWEFNAIKNALMDGLLVLREG